MFIGRENELATMRKLYDSNKFQMVIIYGRRRIGKTTLISKFVENLPAIFFTAQEANDRINLELFSKKVYGFLAFRLAPVHLQAGMTLLISLVRKQKTNVLFLPLMNSPMLPAKTEALNPFCKTLLTMSCGIQVCS